MRAKDICKKCANQSAFEWNELDEKEWKDRRIVNCPPVGQGGGDVERSTFPAVWCPYYIELVVLDDVDRPSIAARWGE